MVDNYKKGDTSGFESDLQNNFEPQRHKLEKKGKKLGVSSGHLYFAIPRLWEFYGPKSRFILLVRKPEEFVRSAMARGFFDTEHPNYCNQLSPAFSEPISSSWKTISVLERNLWYWVLVNKFVLKEFEKIPQQYWRIVKIEELSLDLVLDIRKFIGSDEVDQDEIIKLLNTRINSSPEQPGNIEPNPLSRPVTMPALSEWDEHQKKLLTEYTSDLVNNLYG